MNNVSFIHMCLITVHPLFDEVSQICVLNLSQTGFNDIISHIPIIFGCLYKREIIGLFDFKFTQISVLFSVANR
jgi:hypothetical protein